MKTQWKHFLAAAAAPLGVGILSALLTFQNMMSFDQLIKPSITPPSWLFPTVWTILYLLMGIASYLISVSAKASASEIQQALFSYTSQLIFNFFWPLLFFNLHAYLFAFLWLCVLLFLILLTTLEFFEIDQTAGYLLVPYLIWVTFAGYLNLTIYLLNK